MLRGPKGYTLVELVLALSIFSFMIVILSSGIIQMLRIYQAGIAIRSSQHNARVFMEQASREIRDAVSVSSSNPASGGVNHDALCIVSNVRQIGSGFVARASNTTYYSVQLGSRWEMRKSFQDNVTVIAQPGQPVFLQNGCNVPGGAFDVVSSEDVSVENFEVATYPDRRYAGIRLAIRSLYDNDLDFSDADNIRCQDAASQYCSVTNLRTGVLSGRSLQR